MRTMYRSLLALVLALGASVTALAGAGAGAASAATPVRPTIAFAVEYQKLVFGTATEIEATVESSGQSVFDGTVQLQARTAGSDTWKVVEAPDAAYGFWSIKPTENTAYRVVYSGYTATDSFETSYSPVTSETQVVDVMRNLHTKGNSRTLVIHGKVSPSYAKRKITLQRATCATCRFRNVAVIRTTRNSTWSVKLPAARKKAYYRAIIPAGDGFVRSISGSYWTIRYGG
jgi:hypothetical protein